MTVNSPSRRNAAIRTRGIVAGVCASLVVGGIAIFVQRWIRGAGLPASVSGPHVDGLYPWKAALIFTAGMAVAVGFLDDHPFTRLGPANRVTIVRLMLVALIAALIGEPAVRRAAAAAVVATIGVALLDGLDGWLARDSGMASDFGARFDMETDALLIMVLSVLVWLHGKAGPWVLVGGVARYAFIASGWLFPWMAGPLSPTHRAKTVAVAHMVGLAVALSPIVPPPLSAIAAAVTLGALVWSFAVDIGRLWRSGHSGIG